MARLLERAAGGGCASARGGAVCLGELAARGRRAQRGADAARVSRADVGDTHHRAAAARPLPLDEALSSGEPTCTARGGRVQDPIGLFMIRE